MCDDPFIHVVDCRILFPGELPKELKDVLQPYVEDILAFEEALFRSPNHEQAVAQIVVSAIPCVVKWRKATLGSYYPGGVDNGNSTLDVEEHGLAQYGDQVRCYLSRSDHNYPSLSK